MASALGSLSCFLGKPCNGAEITFVFNRYFDENGQPTLPNKRDIALIDEVYRLWFSDELFDKSQFIEGLDNALYITNSDLDNSGTIAIQELWDEQVHQSEDASAGGICTAIYE